MKYLILTLLCFISLSAFAEQYEIRAINSGNGIISVQMRETSGNPPAAGDFLVDLVFGLKWDATYNVDLSNTINTSYEIRKSDIRKSKNGFHFQSFYANNLPLAIPTDWNADWVEIMNIQNTLDGQQPNGQFLICELGFDNTTDLDININLSGYYIPTINGFANAVSLPIYLIDFEAKKVKQTALLVWNTSSESNSNYFQIEKSKDAKNWQILDKIPAAGISSTKKHYQITDQHPFANTVFYRLKMVDKDGKTNYSVIRNLRFLFSKINLYPNPSHDFLFLEQIFQTDSIITIFSAEGKLMLVQKIPQNSKTTKINIHSLPAGNYFLSIKDHKMIKFVKLE